MSRLNARVARAMARIAVACALIALTPTLAAAQSSAAGLTAEARAILQEGDALAAEARSLDAMIAELQAEQDRLFAEAEERRGEGSGGGDGGTRGDGSQATEPVVIGELDQADLSRIAALQDQIDAMTVQQIGLRQRAVATWERAAAIDAGAADAVLRRIIETSN